MYLTEKHIINSNHKFYQTCDELSFSAKNVYNKALYNVRQHFFETEHYLNYLKNYHLSKTQEIYSYLPAKVFCQVLKLVDRNFKSFFALNKKKKEGKYSEIISIPKYKNKTNGRMVVIYPKQAVSTKSFKEGFIELSKSNIKFRTKLKDFRDLKEVRIVPGSGYYSIEVVYEREGKPLVEDNGSYCGIDLGLNNLVCVGFNKSENEPIIINGRPMKSFNQFYNKEQARLKSNLEKGQKGSKRIKRLTLKRNKKINDYLHKSSRILVNLIVSQGVSRVVIGLNKEWKQNINIGKKNNQNFVNIPHSRFIEMLRYKLRLEGIDLVVREESYTSKCSFLDMEDLSKSEKYLGRRVKRGLFRSGNGQYINADLNGAYNILRKEIPKAFADGIEGLGVNPKRLKVA